MKPIWPSVVLLLTAVGVSPAQDYAPYSRYYGSHHASTVQEGAARGAADMIRSAGQYNLLTSRAAINATEAQSRYIRNRQQWTDTYFDMRATNRAYRAAQRGPKPTMEQVVRYAQAGKPARLSPGELDFISGEITWPLLLDTQPYANQREALESLFSQRAFAGGVSWEEQGKIEQVTSSMLNELKEQIDQVPSSDYMSAKRFVESLAFEANLPST